MHDSVLGSETLSTYESQMIRFSMIQWLSNWFRKLSLQGRILMIALIALLILLSPRLYRGAVDLYGRARCSISGGEWAIGGMAQSPFCLYTFPDGGKVCHSSEECMGGCVLYEIDLGQPPPSVGVCRINNDPFVCHAVIEYPHLFYCAD
jgi:hypothetical protein